MHTGAILLFGTSAAEFLECSNKDKPMLSFSQLFTAATGYAPFRWQERLYQEFLKGNLPPRCNIPTGLGKTSSISIWLLAQRQRHPGHPQTMEIPLARPPQPVVARHLVASLLGLEVTAANSGCSRCCDHQLGLSVISSGSSDR